MNLIPCPECGKQISVNATKCVHCGFPIPLKSCPECGAQYNSALSVCPQCGYDEVAAKAQAELLAQQQAEQARIAAEQHAIRVAQAKKVGKIIGIVLAAIATIAILALTAVYLVKKHAESSVEEIGNLVVAGDFESASEKAAELKNAWWCPDDVQTDCNRNLNKMRTFEEQIVIADSLFEIGEYEEAKQKYDACMHITSNRKAIRQKIKLATDYAELASQITRHIWNESFVHAKSTAEQLIEKHPIDRNRKRLEDVVIAEEHFVEKERIREAERLAEDELLHRSQILNFDL